MRANALLLAGGLGTRLLPLTETTPKCLIDIDQGKPLLEYWVSSLQQAGFMEATINTHHLPDPVRHFMDRIGAERNFDLHESYEPELLGSAGTVSANAHLGEGVEAVLLIYADNLSDISIKDMMSFHRDHDEPITMALFRAENPSACGIATLDDRRRIVEFVEKPERPTSDLANAGIYVIDASIYREIAAMKRFDLGNDVLPDFIGRMSGFFHPGYHRDIGTLDSLEQARADSREGTFRPPTTA
ncbi:MAG: nucleotidyltransferase family protein [Pseudomonadota bacterium]